MNRFIVVDFETTGSSPRQGDQIIQIGAVIIEDGAVTDSFSTFVNPGQAIPAYITQLTGITDEMVADAPTMEEIMPELLRRLDGSAFVAHNASFDLQFLQEALTNQGYYTFDGPVIDTVELARFLLPMQGSYRLIELADDLDIDHDRPHQADSDALATAHLFLYLLEQLQRFPLATIQRLQMLVSSFRSDVGDLLRQLEMEKLTHFAFPEDGGDDPESEWDIYRQIALRKREGNKQDVRQDNVFAVNDSLRPTAYAKADDHFTAQLEGFQRRESQEAMVHAIEEAMEDGYHLLVEAGTGTGKSLAYLFPSAYWAKKHQEPVVISTNTITLQEQLFEKDIPLVKKIVPFPFTAAKLKGRGNYLCLRKFEQSLDEASNNSQEIRLVKAQMVTWLTQTMTGDVEEVSLPPSGALYWQQVKSDTHSCLHRQCPWFSRCYYFRAKEQARQADLLIVNHALLVTDLVTENHLLPSYRVAVVDEAHHLEEAATKHMGKQYNTVQLQYLGDRLGADSTGRIQSFLEDLISWRGETEAQAKEYYAALGKLQLEIRDDVQGWSKQLYTWVLKRGVEETDTGSVTVRYHRDSFAGRNGERLVKNADRLISRLLQFAETLERLLGLAKGGDDTPSYLLKSAITDMHGLLDDLHEASQLLHFLIHCDDANFVYWMEEESRTQRKHVYLYAAPLEVARELSPLFENRHSVIMTSATLTVKNSFSFIKQTFGLDQLPEDQVRTVSLPSPFDYEQQGLILIPSGFPSLGKDNDEEFIQAVIQGCLDIIRAANGRTLILFTANSMLKQVYTGIKELIGEDEFLLLAHGIDSNNRSKLVRSFQRESRAVLFGTSSFWEGVDIPGDALSALVIVRLPFSPPNHPVAVGRGELLKQAGKNPFMSLALPEAVIQFKQGVGRLIRDQHDRGVVVVFDTRIVESRYGRAFLQSLPPYQVRTGPWPELRMQIEPFLAGLLPSQDS